MGEGNALLEPLEPFTEQEWAQAASLYAQKYPQEPDQDEDQDQDQDQDQGIGMYSYIYVSLYLYIYDYMYSLTPLLSLYSCYF